MKKHRPDTVLTDTTNRETRETHRRSNDVTVDWSGGGTVSSSGKHCENFRCYGLIGLAMTGPVLCQVENSVLVVVHL